MIPPSLKKHLCQRCGGYCGPFPRDQLCLACARFPNAQIAGQKAITPPEPQNNTNDLGSILKQYREDHGLTQQELADRLVLDQSWVSNVERGTRKLDKVSSLRFLAERLGLPYAQVGLAEPDPAEYAATRQPDPYQLLVEIRRARESRRYGRPDLGRMWLGLIEKSLKSYLDRFPDLEAQLLAAEFFLALSWTKVELLPFGELMTAVEDVRRALRLVPDFPELLVSRSYLESCLASHSRMADRYSDSLNAIDSIDQTILPPEDLVALNIQSARVSSELGKTDRFAAAINTARDNLESSSTMSILVDPIAISDTHARGFLRLGRNDDATRVISDVERSHELLASPQWRISSTMTAAEVALHTGDESDGLDVMVEAIKAASTAKLTHHLERALSILTNLEQKSDEVQEVTTFVRESIKALGPRAAA